MTLSPGDRLGSYEILAPLGAGGMGEVYRAKDTKLGRDVAVKTLPAALAQDPDLLARFKREAKVLASLNHPNIAQIYGLEENALVMELVSGATLEVGLPVAKALDYARQIAEALEAAHDKAIVHRDLKPGNIMVTPDGVVKVLDFGLSAIGQDPSSTSDGNAANSPTLTFRATQAGVIMGTAAYMSPEQAAGKAVDKRSDIWSFGVVLFEMLTGTRLFDGETISHTLADVLRGPINFDLLPRETPLAIRSLLRRCLDRNLKNRLRDIGEARIAIEAALSGASAETSIEAPQATPGRRNFVPWVTAAALALALGALAWIHFRGQPPVAAALTRFQVPFPVDMPQFRRMTESISPDGRKIAFEVPTGRGGRVLWVRSLDSLDAQPVPDTELASLPAPFFWTFDSRFLVFAAADRKLKKVNVAGGLVQTICDLKKGIWGGSSGQDGTMLLGGLMGTIKRVSAAGEAPTEVTALDATRQEFEHGYPHLLPDGRHFVYFRKSRTPGNSGIYAGSIDAKPSEQSSKPLLVTETGPAYYVPSPDSSTGHLVFHQSGMVLAQSFDPGKLALSGEPAPIAKEVGLQDYEDSGAFTVSRNGVLVYGSDIGGDDAQLTWLDRAGKTLGTVGEPGTFEDFVLSSDAKRAVVSRASPSSRARRDLWLYDLTRAGAFTRFTTHPSSNGYPVFSPDGSLIVFSSDRGGMSDLYQKPASGVKEEEPLLRTRTLASKVVTDWSADGRFLLYTEKSDVWILPMSPASGGSERQPVLFQGTNFTEFWGKFSPDGRWIAFNSDESGRFEVYVREFYPGSDGKPTATPKHRISTNGGYVIGWGDGGKELFWVSQEGQTQMLRTAGIITRPVFQAQPEKTLFQLPDLRKIGIADGKRFLVPIPVKKSAPILFNVVLNWQLLLQR
jgi:Tol biopolymer transport system component/predicted Ser/Thr protein kinase